MVTLFYRKVIKIRDVNETANKIENNKTEKLLKIQWILWTLSLVISVSLSCVYWPLVYTGKDKFLNDALTHAGNAIVNFIDLFIVACPAKFGHFIYPLSFGLVYAFIFSLPYALLGGLNRHGHVYIYNVIDWIGNPKSATIFAFAVLTFLSIVHLVMTGFVKLREKICESRMKKASEMNNREDQDEIFDNPSFAV